MIVNVVVVVVAHVDHIGLQQSDHKTLQNDFDICTENKNEK